jgi:hypothetical protein
VQVKQEGGAPEEVLLTDRPFQIAMGMWAVTVLLIFYFFS